jgi:tripartite-type tricarboxylate transporter receptor subunit TctC
MATTLPGSPSIIVKNMPGAGHLRATNYMYSQAPRDGSTFALIWPSYVMHQIADGRSSKYDAAKFNYIGSSGASNSTIFVWHTTGVKTLEDAMKKEVLMGGTGAGSDTVLYPTLLNRTLHTRFKLVTGYKGAGAIDLAVQRGEVEGRGGSAYSTLVAKHSDWLKSNKIHVLVQIGEKAEPGFENVPMLTSFAKDAKTREIFQIFSYGVALGRPFLAPPNIPAERLADLRKSFMAAVKKPALIAEFKKARLDIEPMTGERLTELVARMVNASDEVQSGVKALVARKKKKK